MQKYVNLVDLVKSFRTSIYNLFASLDYSACWVPVCNECETDEVQSVLSARVLDARKENARASSARGKYFHFGHCVLNLRAPKALRTAPNN